VSFQRLLGRHRQATQLLGAPAIGFRRAKGGAEKFYDFRDLISLRTAKQLIEKGVSANRLRRSLVALNEKLSQVRAPLTELRILANGRDVIVEHDGARLETNQRTIRAEF